MTAVLRFALTATLCVLAGCASVAHSTKPERSTTFSSPTSSFEIKASYGTLSFWGTVDRADLGHEYEFQTHIEVTFHPDERVNHTPVADLQDCRLVASVPQDSIGPWQVLYQESHPIRVRLTQDGQMEHLPVLTFRLPKTIAARAKQVGLAVTDGHFMWPIPVPLQ
jgi:hypothetical protein